ncbi:molybdenum cofactor biosynthesis protein MoaE [Flavobacteriaceae bacterium M23B6Z8]
MKKIIEIVDVINCTDVYQVLGDPESGGICVFIGTVRNQTNTEPVNQLHFEAYDKMALREMHRIADAAFEKWQLQKIVLRHVTGSKEVGDPVVLVGASSAHRDNCFEACRYLIDTLKEKVPIWKKEFFKNKEVWVSAHP